MSYRISDRVHSVACAAVIHSCGLRPRLPQSGGVGSAPNKNSEMNYDAIKTGIKTLVEQAKLTPRNRVETKLEPIREDMLEARRQGVKLHALYEVIKAEMTDISPSSFGKYAQRHLRVRKQRRKTSAKSTTGKQNFAEQVRQKTKETKPLRLRNETKNQPLAPSKFVGKPRIARGNY